MADIPQDYSNALNEVLPDNVFTADGCESRLFPFVAPLSTLNMGHRSDLGNYTQAASYLVMLGSLATALAALFALFARRCAFSLATIFSIIPFLVLAFG